MSSEKNALKTEPSRARRMVPALIVLNVMLGLAFAVALGVLLVRDQPAANTARPPSFAPAPDPLAARANALIAELHCPCAGCGHSFFRNCDNGCGEHSAVQEFVVRHLRSGTDDATVLAHLKSRFGDLTTVASAQAAWESRHPRNQGPASSPGRDADEIPPDLMQLLNGQKGNS